MRVRSALLVACMLVVPLLAMFSHKIPRDFRAAALRRLWQPMQPATASAGPAESAVPVAQVAGAEVPQPPPEPTVEPFPTPAAVPAPPSSAAVRMQPVSPGTAAAAADIDTVRTEVSASLARLGAISFECVPSATGGLHRCSCRVPADPSGQLQRMFQSSNPDPAVAMRNLLGQVQFWRQRVAARSTTAHARSDLERERGGIDGTTRLQ